MNKKLRIFFAAAFVFASNVSAQIFYVDATGGNDSWQGTLPNAQASNGPWKSLTKVSNTYFVPGDSVLLKCGESWRQQMIVTSSGAVGKPITYGAYGDCNDGNKPVIDGSTEVSGWAALGGGKFGAAVAVNKTPLNLVTNSGFDTDVNDWKIYSNGATSSPEWSADCGVSGGCLKFTTSASGGHHLYTQLPFAIQAGVHYRLKFMARANQAGGIVYVAPLQFDGSPGAAATSSFTLSNTWQTYETTFVSTATLTKNTRINFNVPAGLELYLDSVDFRRITDEADTAKQVFLDGQYQRLAQYPNKGFMSARSSNEFLTIRRDSFDCNNQTLDRATTLYGGSDLALTSEQQTDLVGAGIHYRSNAWTIEDSVITAFDAGTKIFSWTTPSEFEICASWGYFLDNKPWMLDIDGEWYYDPTLHQLQMFLASGTPDGRVLVGHLDYGVFANARRYITIDGLSIRKAVTGISAKGGSNLIIRNSDVADSGDKAINIDSSPYSQISGCQIINSVRDGVWARRAHHSEIRNNSIVNTGVIGAPRKSVAAIMMGCHDCGASGTQSVIEANKIRNSGYVGILIGDQSRVSGNHIVDSCMVLGDCGGIYTSGPNFNMAAGWPNLSRITDNIVENVFGNVDGLKTGFGSPAAQGIYLDEYSNSVQVTRNTVINADNGLQIHKGASNVASNNVIYGSRLHAIWMQESATAGSIHDNQFNDNQYFNVKPEYVYRLDSNFDTTINFANYLGNRYSMLYSDAIGHERYKPSTVFVDNFYTYQKWITAKNETLSSAFDAFAVSPAHVLAVNSTNAIRNHTFEADPTVGGPNGWAKYNKSGDASRIWETACFTGRCVNLWSGTSTAILSSPNFSIYKDRTYRVRADIRAAQVSQNLRLVVRENGVPDGFDANGKLITRYDQLGLYKTVSLFQDWQSYSFVFKAIRDAVIENTSGAGARFDFEVEAASQTVYVDNVFLEEVTAELNDPADDSAIVINPTLSEQLKDCPDAATNPAKCSQYVRFADGSLVQWPITVPAMGSEIVVWSQNPMRDSDRDGVVDSNDICREAPPANVPVDERGCSFAQRHSANLAILLTDTPDPAVLGGTVNYTITVTNAGPLAATNVMTSGSLPGCSLGTIPNGGSATCTHAIPAVTAGVFTQTASVSATETDSSPGNNSASTSTNVQAMLTLSKAGSGTVTSDLPGINCGPDCSEPYNSNTAVTLTATPEPNALFDGWRGCDSSSGVTCTLSMNTSKTVIANFSSGLPDLTVASIVAAQSGTLVLINDRIANAGPGGAGSFAISYYLSSNPTYEADDPLLCTRSVAALAAGSSNPASGTTQSSCPIPSVAQGNYYVLAIADSAQTVAEVTESNNTSASAMLAITGIDLLPTALTATRSGTTKVLVSDTVKNQGSQGAGRFTIRYYLSTNTTYEVSDIALASSFNGSGSCSRTRSSLSAGASSSVSNKTCYKPTGALADVAYYVLVVNDSVNTVSEFNETNNVRASTGTMQW